MRITRGGKVRAGSTFCLLDPQVCYAGRFGYSPVGKFILLLSRGDLNINMEKSLMESGEREAKKRYRMP